MKKFRLFGIIVSLVIVLLVVVTVVSYNSLVMSDVRVDNMESEVINRLNERHDLIGQLVDTVTGLQDHAENIYQMITDARAGYASAVSKNDIDGMIEADASEANAVNQLLVVLESNPEGIYAGPAFQNLMDNISAMEAALAQARRDYNNSVAKYNESTRVFPTNLYASMFGFDVKKPYWRLNNGADEIPQINFD
jgi:LemA protein